MKATPRQQSLVLLLGMVVGFAVAVIAARQATAYSKPSNFKRFHQQISPDTSFYPPFSMMENLATTRWQPGKTVVIIGGNSILNGVGQPEKVLWSQGLQDRLGERFVVVNLSFRGAYASEGAALVAESLIRQNIPTIYVANTAPGAMARPYESVYSWVFWDALAQGHLLPNAPRAVELAHRFAVLPPSITDGMHAKELAAQLNRPLRFEELWHHVAYRHFSTVWTYVTRDNFLKPRDQLPDFEPPTPPLENRFRNLLEAEMQITRGYGNAMTESDGHGGWRPMESIVNQTHLDIDEIFAPALRPHMLMLLVRNCPYYRDKLTAEEKTRDALLYTSYEKVWQAHGIACVTVGNDFTAEDYFDRTHLVGSGGAKLADLVAAEVRQLAPP